MTKTKRNTTREKNTPTKLLWRETKLPGGFQTSLNKKCTIYFGPSPVVWHTDRYEWRVGIGKDISPTRQKWDPQYGELLASGTVRGKTETITRGVAKAMAVREGRKICRELYPNSKTK